MSYIIWLILKGNLTMRKSPHKIRNQHAVDAARRRAQVVPDKTKYNRKRDKHDETDTRRNGNDVPKDQQGHE